MATRDLSDRDAQLRALEGGPSGGGGNVSLPTWLQAPGRFGPTTLRPGLNRPAQPGYDYRSPVQTNANSVFPHPLEDAVASQRADLGRMGRALNPSAASERGRLMQQEAGGRALTRTASRAGVGALAVEAGNEARKQHEESSNAAKEKRAAAKADAEAAAGKADQDVDTSSASPSAVRGYSTDMGGYKRGGKVKKMASGGMTPKASSASKRADGIAQRGKTKGRMC